ncbi:MAG: acetyl-CoA carboxyl transferase [Gemmatimonas sp. SG8_28]|jgi:acetyl-CoA carboxylase carboxyl transferase subunit beta|nr:MAG: acetyl-CoA carboxyl transferase [Gemmatimonas sp. SG8_28]
MAWFRKDKRTRAPQREKLEIPADAWDKCEQCGHVDISEKFERVLQVCPQCGFHRRIGAHRYIDVLTDEGSFVELYGGLRSVDALGFEGYSGRLDAAHRKAGTHDGLIAGHGTLTGLDVNIGAMDFKFMGGSMGSVVGEKVARLLERSIERRVPLILVSASGGARMQEGVLSLMQMAKTSALMAALHREGLPYISILTNPTTGGVSASYAMQGDVNFAEPGAVVGFAGPRVIKQTIGQDLPEGFQTAEFLEEHGMVDLVVPRPQMRMTVARVIRMMTGQAPLEDAD